MKRTRLAAVLAAAALMAALGCTGFNPAGCQDYLKNYRVEPEVTRHVGGAESWTVQERIEFGRYLDRNGLAAGSSLGETACWNLALRPRDGEPTPETTGESRRDDGPTLRPALPGDPLRMPGTGLGISP